MVLQFFKTTAASSWPTQQELRNMSYMAIAEGANGLFYWSIGVRALAWVCSGWCDEKVEYFTRLKNVLVELNSLQPALSSLDRPDLLVSNSNPSIHTRVKFANNKGYLIASNYTNSTAAATFTWAQTPTLITVYNESRTLPPGSPSFTDSFSPYQAHVYEISTVSLPPDTTPPTVPANLTATAISSTQINLSWTASTDNVGVAGYKVYRGGIQIATVTSGTTYSDTGLSPSTTYSYTVSAYDAAGNVSEQSVSVTATT
ncbi:MAG: fibronectin type III domain-containing protein, partial [Elusimicrobia bacterium]|nr:fibronectin type III domain-containing protein [Elusimicrobiota bacterium]